MRVAGLPAVALASVVLLPACSPPDVTGITLTDERVPVVDNCGAFITRVEAVKAAGHRPVWSAHVTAEGLDDHGGAAPVELGRLPDDDWVEDRPLALDPRPATWLFTVETDTGEHDTIRVADDALEPGMVYRPGHDPVSQDEFLDGTCLGPGAWLSGVAPLVAGGASLAFASVMGRHLLRRKAARAAPPGGPPGAPA
jgi:hypothetical protein